MAKKKSIDIEETGYQLTATVFIRKGEDGRWHTYGAHRSHPQVYDSAEDAAKFYNVDLADVKAGEVTTS